MKALAWTLVSPASPMSLARPACILIISKLKSCTHIIYINLLYMNHLLSKLHILKYVDIPCWRQSRRICSREQCDWGGWWNHRVIQGAWTARSARTVWSSSSPCVAHLRCGPFLSLALQHAWIEKCPTLNMWCEYI